MKKRDILRQRIIVRLVMLLCLAGFCFWWTSEAAADFRKVELNTIEDKFREMQFSENPPCIYLNGQLYYWDEVATTGTARMKRLPTGFTLAGEIRVTEDIPEKDCETKGFDMWGAVYSNEDIPGVVYAWIETDEYEWLDGGAYVRFITEDMRESGNRHIYLYGKLYEIDKENPAMTEELPEGFEQVGRLKYLGKDYMPDEDFETNITLLFVGDVFQKREVYVNPEDSSRIFVAAERDGNVIVSYYEIAEAEQQN